MKFNRTPLNSILVNVETNGHRRDHSALESTHERQVVAEHRYLAWKAGFVEGTEAMASDEGHFDAYSILLTISGHELLPKSRNAGWWTWFALNAEAMRTAAGIESVKAAISGCVAP